MENEQGKMKQYDKIVQGYEEATKRPLRKYAYESTIKHYLGSNVQGKRVLDLACGEGISTRIIKDLGAKEVVGIDESEEQIKKAKLKDPNSIYLVGDVIKEDFSDLGKFDIITSMLFTTYIPTEKDLDSFFSNVTNHLVKGGDFYILTPNLSSLKNGCNSYGIKIEKTKNNDNSRILNLSDFDGNLFCQAQVYYLSKLIYEKLFRKNGFNVTWHKGIVSQKGIEKYGGEFWEDYLKNPVYNIIKAKLILPNNDMIDKKTNTKQ